MMSANVSAIIPTYNRGHCIRNAIDSVFAQTQSCREVIVIDDGSTDNTSEVLRTYGEKIRVIHQRNSGPSVARNVGIEAACGELIAFLDSDDEWDSSKIASQAEAFAADESLIAHVTNGAVFVPQADAPIDFFATRIRTCSLQSPTRIDRPLRWAMETVVMTPGIMARKRALIDAGLFDPHLRMFEDMDLFCRLALAGPWIFDPAIRFRVHRRGPVGQSLSEQCASTPGHSSASLTRVYSKLLKSGRLPAVERSSLRRRLSAARADYASVERHQRGFWHSACTFVQSIADYPSPTAFARAGVGVLGGRRGLSWLRRLKARGTISGFTR